MQKVCVIIPCYNEEYRIDQQLLQSFIINNPYVYLCLINDGSSDNTLMILLEFKKLNTENIMILNLKNNVGKAEAVRSGMLECAKLNKFDYFAYFDADFSTPLNEVITLFSVAQNKKVKFVLGSRIKRLGAIIERSKIRHLFGRIFSTAASLILNLPVYDTQCGAKLISKEWLDVAFEKPFISSWLFDVEILARLRNEYGRNELLKLTVEVPLTKWVEKGKSKIKLIHLVRIPLELILIHRKYNFIK